MTSLNPQSVLRLDQARFNIICSDLKSGCERFFKRISIVDDGLGPYPRSQSKQWLFQRKNSEETAQIICEFFEANIDLTLKHIDTVRFIKKNLSMKSQTKSKFHQLIAKLWKELGVRDKVSQITQAQEESAKKQSKILEQQQANLQNLTELQSEISFNIQELEQDFVMLTNKLDFLKHQLDEESDTVLTCADNEKILTQVELLAHKIRIEPAKKSMETPSKEKEQNTKAEMTQEKDKITKEIRIPFFYNYIHSSMKTMYLTEEDKKNNPKVIHGFDLRDFSKLTVFKLLEFIDKPHVVRKIKDYNEAYELYRLADYLNYTDLIEALIPIFVSLLDFKKSVQLLIDEKLLPEDSELFVDLAINQLLKDERQLIFTLSKYEIKLPYFLKLARRAIGNHSRLFNYTLMMEYAHRYSKSLNLSMKDVIYKGEVGERFFDLIPFKVLHIDDFLDIFCKTKILHSDDIKTLSPQIRDNKKLDTFEFKEARNGKLYWNLTSEKVRSLSDRNEVASPEFSYNNVREYYIHFLNMDGYYWIGMRADLVNYVSIYDTPLEGGIITIHNNGNVTKMMHRIKIQEVEKILIANNRCLEIEIQLK